MSNYVDPPVGWGSTYCFTAVGVGVLVGVGVTPITKAPSAQIFSSPVGSLCHTHGVVQRLSSVVRRPSSVVCRLRPP